VTTPLPLGIMHGGGHFMDYDPTGDLRRTQQCQEDTSLLPQTILFEQIEEKGLLRPAPTCSRHKVLQYILICVYSIFCPSLRACVLHCSISESAKSGAS
jgi:hypothetical protein